MIDRKEIINNLINISKKRVNWAFDTIKNNENFREELTPRLNFLYDFYINDLTINNHPEFWLKTHKLFELEDEEILGKELVIARNIIRSIDDYKQYLINKIDVGQKINNKEEDKTPTERGVFDSKVEENEDDNVGELSEDNNTDNDTYGQLYKRKKNKRFYGNYYQTYNNKKNTSKKSKQTNCYEKTKKKIIKKRSSLIKSY